jgi:hypothetical protein
MVRNATARRFEVDEVVAGAAVADRTASATGRNRFGRPLALTPRLPRAWEPDKYAVFGTRRRRAHMRARRALGLV